MNNDNMYQSMLYGMGAQNVLGNLASLVSGGRIQAPPPPNMYQMMNMKMAFEDREKDQKKTDRLNAYVQALPSDKRILAELAPQEYVKSQFDSPYLSAAAGIFDKRNKQIVPGTGPNRTKVFSIKDGARNRTFQGDPADQNSWVVVGDSPIHKPTTTIQAPKSSAQERMMAEYVRLSRAASQRGLTPEEAANHKMLGFRLSKMAAGPSGQLDIVAPPDLFASDDEDQAANIETVRERIPSPAEKEKEREIAKTKAGADAMRGEIADLYGNINPSTVGVGGSVNRLMEWASGQVGGTDQPATDVRDKLTFVQSQNWRDLVGSGQLSKGDYYFLDVVIPKGDWRTTPTSQREALARLDSVLARSWGGGEQNENADEPPPPPPPVGHVAEGFKFIGGDPADQNNWRKVQ